MLYEARELIADSGGAGEFRGGLGQELILQAYGGRVKEGESLVLYSPNNAHRPVVLPILALRRTIQVDTFVVCTR